MTFSDKQVADLSGPLSRASVKTRKQSGRTLSYVEGWHVIAEANRIFGHDNWTRETIEMRLVAEAGRAIGEEKAPGWGVTYVCRVRITVDDVVRDGFGAGHGIDRDLGQAHESAAKEAETDAMKRAFMTFGNPFGLALYDKEQTSVVDEVELARQRYVEQCKVIIESKDKREDLQAWWVGEGKTRRDFDLSPADVIVLKNLVTEKLEKLKATAS
jgi:recombination DNA repair RAD52 pathway protein